MRILALVAAIAALTACSDPVDKAAREYRTALETHIELNITDDRELCRLSRKAMQAALRKNDKAAYGEWLLRAEEYCK